MLQTSLHQIHRRLDATWGDKFGWEVPLRYGDAAEEYLALKEGAALIDRSYMGRIQARGNDALDLLNRLSTNKLEELPQGGGTRTVLTSNKGRIIDWLLVTARSDHLLYLTSPQQRQRVLEWFDFYTFAEESVLKDVTDATAMVGIHGPRAADVLAQAGWDISGLERYGSTEASPANVPAVVVRTDAAGVPGYDLMVDAAQAEAAWSALTEAGALPVGDDAFEMVRVEQGVPQYGRELSEEHNPLEARLKGFVSFSKGCYVGQEVVTRLNTYKKVQRTLMAVYLEGEAQPGDKLEQDAKPVGELISVVRIPTDGRVVGLAYIRGAAAQHGTRLQVSDSEVMAELHDPPFALATEPAEVR